MTRRIVHLPNYDAIDKGDLEAQLQDTIRTALKQVAEGMASRPITKNDLEVIKFVYQVVQDSKKNGQNSDTLETLAREIRERRTAL